MKSKLLLLSLLMGLGLAVSAQEEVGTFSVIPRLGIGLANMTGNEIYATSNDGSLKLESKNKAGLWVGVDVDYQVQSRTSVSLGLHYAILGSRYPDYQSGDNEAKQYTGYRDWHTNLHYLNVPLLFNCYVAKGLALKTGLQMGVMLDAKTEYEATEFKVNDNGSKEYGETTKHEESLKTKKIDVSIPIGVSYEYMNVILDARYNFGLANVYDVDALNSKNRYFMFTAGYRFRL